MRCAAAARPCISTQPTRPANGWLDGNPTWSSWNARTPGPDVAVRGPAAELLLVLSRRRPLDAAPTLELQGDRALLDRWIEHMDWVTG